MLPAGEPREYADVTPASPARIGWRTLGRFLALALAALLLGTYWPIVKTFDLYRADLGIKGEWIGGHAKLITAVSPGGAADVARLVPGDVLEFDPDRNDDWVLASYRNMPQGFTGTLPVRHHDGRRTVVTLAPERVAYLPTTTDRVALIVRLGALTLLALVAALLVWTHPSVMTWSFFFGMVSGAPSRVWVQFYFAYSADLTFNPWTYVACTWPWVIALVPFGLSFPHDSVRGLSRWVWVPGLLLGLALIAYLMSILSPQPFVQDAAGAFATQLYTVVAGLSVLMTDAALVRTYLRSSPVDRARLKWAVLGITASFLLFNVSFLYVVARSVLPNALSGSPITPHHWVGAASSVILALSIGYAVLRQRVVDVQFAVSRTVVYGVVSTIVLVFLAVLHWLLGREIEHSGLAFGLEGLAAVGLGLVLHRASHGINMAVDRVLFRKHHAAEECLRQVTVALPFATTEQAIADAIVREPAEKLQLASAALFYRESAEGPLRRVLAVGWDTTHASNLDQDSFLLRFLQAEHQARRLDDDRWLSPGMPQGLGRPVLAIPIVTQHALNAVVLYGSHANGTVPDPDEVALLEALAKAAAASHQQVRIARLVRENAALAMERSALNLEKETQQRVLDRLESRLETLAQQAGP